MKCLIDRISSCNPNHVLWVADSVGQVDVQRLIQALASIDPSDWQGKRVAIGKLPVLEFVSAITFLDGLAQKIVLLPAEDDKKTRDSRLDQANIDILIEGNGLNIANILISCVGGGVNHIKQLADMKRPSAIQTKWLLPTSGTTGIPKLIEHTFSSLTRSMTPRYVGESYIWGSLYSLRRFAGLQVFLQSWMCCTPLILNQEDEDLNEVMYRFIRLGCNALSATPSMWRKLAMHPFFERLNLKQITLGGEIVDQAILDMLKKKFPSARITHIYASTEAGVGFAVRDGLAGFPADYLIKAPIDINIRIDEYNHLIFESKNFQSTSRKLENSLVDSGDIVRVKNERVYFLGRANGSINVGGNKVMPEEIESVIKELPCVSFVQVSARKSAILGNLVEAAITPTSGILFDAAFKKQVISHCRERLESYKVPAFIVAADEIKLTASGKLSRINAV